MRPYSRNSRVTRSCLVCGKAFSDWASQFTPRAPGKYCSRACKYLGTRTTPESFWRQVLPPDENDCLLFGGNLTGGGYGRISVAGRSVKAHIYAYSVVVGPVPAGLLVCHHCDVPACVNPNHLYLDTQKGNLADMYLRDRGPTGDRSGPRLVPEHFRGEHNGRAKVTDEEVREIRRMAADGVLQRQIAELYGIGKTTVSEIVRRIHWPHVE